VGTAISIIRGGKIMTEIICIRIKRITIGFTISITVQTTTLKRILTSKPTGVEKRSIETQGETRKMF
jgi:hypothetical protein